MSKIESKYTVTETGYTYRIPDDIDEGELDNVVYIYSDPHSGETPGSLFTEMVR